LLFNRLTHINQDWRIFSAQPLGQRLYNKSNPSQRNWPADDAPARPQNCSYSINHAIADAHHKPRNWIFSQMDCLHIHFQRVVQQQLADQRLADLQRQLITSVACSEPIVPARPPVHPRPNTSERARFRRVWKQAAVAGPRRASKTLTCPSKRNIERKHRLSSEYRQVVKQIAGCEFILPSTRMS
jgi:hypothetical protein